MTDPVGFLGLSHLGVVMSACWASLGDRVIAVGEPVEVAEPGVDALEVGDRLTITHDPSQLARCALVFVTLDTSDVAAVERLLESAVPHLRHDAVVVVMSQVRPGTTRRFAIRWKPRTFYYLAETLITGKAIERCLRPDRFIVGLLGEGWKGSLSARMPLWSALERFHCPIFAMSYESAEFAKLAINLYLASSIEYSNRMALAAGRIGADWLNEVVPALRLDPRIGRDAYLLPGTLGPNIRRDVTTYGKLFGLEV